LEKVVIENSTLYHADCREIIPQLDGIGTVITDPPYGMSFQSGYRTEKHLKIANDDAAAMTRIAYEIPSDHSSYIFCRWDNIRDFPEPPSSLVAWVKPNWSMGDLDHEHGRQYEMIAFYPGPDHQWPYKRPTRPDKRTQAE